jgi:hypothetical protein
MKSGRSRVFLGVVCVAVVVPAFLLGVFWAGWLQKYFNTLLIYVGLPVGAVLVWHFLLGPLLNNKKLQEGVPHLLKRFQRGRAEPNAELDLLIGKWNDQVKKLGSRGLKLWGRELNLGSRELNLGSDPWYLWLGPSGSGKTQGIRNGEFDLLVPRDWNVGATDYLDFWPIVGAMFIDSAGMLTEQEDPQRRELLHQLLDLLKKCRRAAPLNGLVLVIPAKRLTPGESAEELAEQKTKRVKEAGNLRLSVEAVRAKVGKRFPVYVVVTMSDLLDGFSDFFGCLENPESRYEILGWSNRAPLDEAFEPGIADGHLRAMAKRLKQVRLRLLRKTCLRAESAGTSEADRLFALPQSFEGILKPLQQYLEAIFGQHGTHDLFFRGVYFTSSMHATGDLDRALFERLGIPYGQPKELKEYSYFWRDFGEAKAWKEGGLVTSKPKVLQWMERCYAQMYLGGAIAALAWLGYAFWDTWALQKHIAIESAYWSAAASAANWVTNRPPWVRSGPLWQPVVSSNLVFLGGTKVEVESGVGPVVLMDFLEKLADFARHDLAAQQQEYWPVEHWQDGRSSAQGVVVEASLVDPIIWAARQKLLLNAGSRAGNSNEPRPEQLVEIITNLIGIELEINDSTKVSAAELATRLRAFSAFLWPTNYLGAMGARLEGCLSNVVWPSKHISGGETLKENEGISSGLKVVEQRVMSELDTESREALPEWLKRLRAVETVENELVATAATGGWVRVPKAFETYEGKAADLNDFLQRQTGGVMHMGCATIGEAVSKYHINWARCKQNYDRFGEWLDSRQKNMPNLPLLKDITDHWAQFWHLCDLNPAADDQAAIQLFDDLFLRTNTASKRLFQVRWDTYKALTQVLAFPLIPGEGTNVLTAQQVVDFRAALLNLQSALEPNLPQKHRTLLQPWRDRFMEKLPITESLVDERGQIRKCKVRLEPTRNGSGSRVWRYIHSQTRHSDPIGSNAVVDLGDFPLDKEIRIWVTKYSDKSDDKSTHFFAELNQPWAAIRLLNLSPAKGGGTNWDVELSALTGAGAERLTFKLLFEHEISPLGKSAVAKQ